MATLISCATGNFTAAATWALVDSTALSDSEAGNTALTTSYVESQAFTPGAITIDGIAVKLAVRVASPTGTVSVRLALAGVTVTGTEVTLNVSDLPTCDATNNEGGWILFKFAASVTLLAATAYTVSAKCSVASEATLYRDSTAGNWSRLLRTTTTQAPAAADILHVLGEHTGAGTGNDLTVTMDNTLTTDFGPGVDGSVALTICKRGTLTYGASASTDYYLKLSGNLIVYNGGALNIGTVATPIPSTSSAVLEFDPVADGGMGAIYRNGSTIVKQGATVVDRCKLNTDEAAAQTILGVDTNTGWVSGQEIGIASTTATYSECEKRTVSSSDATTVTVSAGLTNAHSGTSPTQAEVIMITRNVKIRSATSTIMAYVNIKATAAVDIDYAEFYYLGENATNKRGIEIETTTGSCNIQYSSFHDFEDRGICVLGTSANNITFSNNVCYNLASTTGIAIYLVNATSGTSITFNNNIVMLAAAAANNGFALYDVGGTFTNNIVAGINGTGFYFYENDVIGTDSGNVAHSCVIYGFYYRTVFSSTISSLTAWRNDSSGVFVVSIRDCVFDTMTLFGNSPENISIGSSGCGVITFKSVTSNGDTSFSTTNGIMLDSAPSADIILENCNFSTVSGIKIAHTNDINMTTGTFLKCVLINCILGATTEVANQENLVSGYVKSQKHDQTAGNHKAWFKYGTITIDTTYYKTASPSQRLTPNNASYKLESGNKKTAVASGGTVTFSVWIRKSSVAAGGADYNGNQPRLVLKKNIAAGINADTVLATMTVGLDTWEQLSGTTAAVTDDAVLEVVADCDGTAGFINVDDWGVS